MLAPIMGMYINDCKPHIYGNTAQLYHSTKLNSFILIAIIIIFIIIIYLFIII